MKLPNAVFEHFALHSKMKGEKTHTSTFSHA